MFKLYYTALFSYLIAHPHLVDYDLVKRQQVVPVVYQSQSFYGPGDTTCAKGTDFFVVFTSHVPGSFGAPAIQCVALSTDAPTTDPTSVTIEFKEGKNFQSVVPKLEPNTDYLVQEYFNRKDCLPSPEMLQFFALGKCVKASEGGPGQFVKGDCQKDACGRPTTCEIAFYDDEKCTLNKDFLGNYVGPTEKCLSQDTSVFASIYQVLKTDNIGRLHSKKYDCETTSTEVSLTNYFPPPLPQNILWFERSYFTNSNCSSNQLEMSVFTAQDAGEVCDNFEPFGQCIPPTDPTVPFMSRFCQVKLGSQIFDLNTLYKNFGNIPTGAEPGNYLVLKLYFEDRLNASKCYFGQSVSVSQTTAGHYTLGFTPCGNFPSIITSFSLSVDKSAPTACSLSQDFGLFYTAQITVV